MQLGRKTQELSPTMRKLPFCVYVDERAFGASMTGLKLVDSFMLQVDGSIDINTSGIQGSTGESDRRPSPHWAS